jgi:endoglucanase
MTPSLSDRRVRWSGALVLAVLLVLALVAGPAAAATRQSCPDPSQSGALHVSGNEVLTKQGQPFTFYGIAVYGGLMTQGTEAEHKLAMATSNAQIKAAKYWYANTIRIQVAERDLFKHAQPADGVNRDFLADLCRQVQLIRRQGMEAVINDQTERSDQGESNPTSRTTAFWKVVAPMFKNQPGVIFDLFNEPRLLAPAEGPLPTHLTDWIWRVWRSGGTTGGVKYIGMQGLIDSVRQLGANNIIWVEGPYVDNSLGNERYYPVTGKNLVWSIHHPHLSTHGASYWNRYFGYITATYPMVDGEWGQYAAANRPECQADAYTMVPQYLSYLHAHNIGVLGWSLQPGAMVADPDGIVPTYDSVSTDTSNPLLLTTPSTMSSSYACSSAKTGQGAGQLLMNDFKTNSTPAP